MASPSKALIDPTGLTAYPITIPCPSANPGRPLDFARYFLAPAQVNGPHVERFAVLALFTAMQTSTKNPSPCVSPGPYSLLPVNYKIATFSPIYQERGASASRGTEGQLYPTPF